MHPSTMQHLVNLNRLLSRDKDLHFDLQSVFITAEGEFEFSDSSQGFTYLLTISSVVDGRDETRSSSPSIAAFEG